MKISIPLGYNIFREKMISKKNQNRTSTRKIEKTMYLNSLINNRKWWRWVRV